MGARIDKLGRIPVSPSVLIAVSLASFFTYYDITNYAYVAPVLKAAWSIGDDQVAIGASMTIIGYVIGAFAITKFADSYGRKPAFIASVVILGLGSVLAASSQDMTQMSAFRLLTGIGIGSEIAISSVYIGELSPRSKRGRYTSLVIVLGWIGLAASGPISLALIGNQQQQQQQGAAAAMIEGWRAIMLLPGIAALISLPLRLRMPESPRWALSKGRLAEANAILASLGMPPITAADKPREDAGWPSSHSYSQKAGSYSGRRPLLSAASFWKGIDGRRMALLVATWFLVLVPIYASLLLVVEYVNQGFALEQAIAINIISGLGFVAGGALVIPVADRMDRKYQVSIASAAMALGFILRGVWAGDFAGQTAAGFVAFASTAWLLTNLYTYTAESFPTRVRSFGTGMAEGSGRALSSLGPLIFVMLQPYGFFNLMAGLSLFAIAAACIVTLAGPLTRGRALESLNEER